MDALSHMAAAVQPEVFFSFSGAPGAVSVSKTPQTSQLGGGEGGDCKYCEYWLLSKVLIASVCKKKKVLYTE